MRQIYDYKDLRKLEETELYPELRSSVLVTITGSMMEELSAYYPDLLVVDIHEMLDVLAEEWQKNFKHPGNFIRFREEIERYIEESGEAVEPKDALVLRRNAADMWNSIELLVEAGVHPEEIPDDAGAQACHFRTLWSRMEGMNREIRAFRHLFEQGGMDAGEYRQRMKRLEETVNTRLESWGRQKVSLKDRTWILVGGYYITPIQQRILDLLDLYESVEGRERRVRYLNCYDRENPFFFEIWEKTYAEEYRAGVTVDLQGDLHKKNPFAGAVNPGSGEAIDLEMHRHRSPYSLAEEVIAAAKAGHQIYTADAKATDRIMREYYPEAYDDRHFLSYPMGQYLRALHDMWNSVEDRMVLEFDTVFAGFASGWLEKDGVKGTSYLKELKDLRLFFRDCRRIEEWEARMEMLKRTRHILNNYERRAGDDRYARMRVNSYNSFAFYRVPEETLDRILMLIRTMIRDGRTLFGGEARVVLAEHFRKLNVILQAHAGTAAVTEQEKNLVQDLRTRLEEVTSGSMACHLSGLKDALILLMGGNEDASYLDPDLKRTTHVIRPLLFADTAILREYGQDVDLLMADEYRLPGKAGTLPWPIRGKLLERIRSAMPENRYLAQMISITENVVLLNRYMMYCLMDTVTENTHPKVHVTWLSEEGEQEIGASPYLTLFGLQKESETADSEADLRLAGEVLREEAASGWTDPMDFVPGEEDPEEVQLDTVLCPARAFYSYVLQEAPAFRSEFQVEYVSRAQLRDYPSARSLQRERLPFLTEVEHRQLEGSIPTGPANLADTTRRDRDKYLDLHFLQEWIRDLAELNPEGRDLRGETYGKKKKKLCMFCPCSEICREQYEEVKRS